MAATILVKDLMWRVCAALGDTLPQYSRWEERELVMWANDAQSAIVTWLPAAFARLDAIKLKPGTKQSIASIAAADCIPGDGSTQATTVKGRQLLSIVRNMGVNGLTPGRAVRAVERDSLDMMDPNWHLSTGRTIYEYTFDPKNPRYFYVIPGVGTSQPEWVEASFVADPEPIPPGGAPGSEVYLYSGSNTTTIRIDDEHIELLVDYTCGRAHLQDSKYAEPMKARFHVERFVNSVNAKVSALTGLNPNLTQLPGVSLPGMAA